MYIYIYILFYAFRRHYKTIKKDNKIIPTYHPHHLSQNLLHILQPHQRMPRTEWLHAVEVQLLKLQHVIFK